MSVKRLMLLSVAALGTALWLILPAGAAGFDPVREARRQIRERAFLLAPVHRGRSPHVVQGGEGDTGRPEQRRLQAPSPRHAARCHGRYYPLARLQNPRQGTAPEVNCKRGY